MAAKNQKHSPNWGGRRPNQTGRPRKTLSEAAVERALEACERYAERFGKTTDELLLDLCYGVDWAEKATHQVRLKAIEAMNRRTAPPLTEGGEADKAGSIVRLPVREDDPGKVVQLKEAK